MDSRFPTYYLQDRRVLKATPTAFRLFVIGSAWSVSNMTDGLIPSDDFPLIPLAQTHDADALVSLGLWSKVDAGWRINDFLKIQTSASQMEASLANRKAADAERQRKKYARDKEKREQEIEGESTQASRETHVRIEGRGKAEAEEEAEARTMNLPNNETFDANTGEVFDDNNPWKNKPLKTDSGPNLMDQFMRGETA
ncbi:hypothetical protein [Corynebacterium casei]